MGRWPAGAREAGTPFFFFFLGGCCEASGKSAPPMCSTPSTAPWMLKLLLGHLLLLLRGCQCREDLWGWGVGDERCRQPKACLLALHRLKVPPLRIGPCLPSEPWVGGEHSVDTALKLHDTAKWVALWKQTSPCSQTKRWGCVIKNCSWSL